MLDARARRDVLDHRRIIARLDLAAVLTAYAVQHREPSMVKSYSVLLLDGGISVDRAPASATLAVS